jgi:hypothetical protein
VIRRIEKRENDQDHTVIRTRRKREVEADQRQVEEEVNINTIITGLTRIKRKAQRNQGSIIIKV